MEAEPRPYTGTRTKTRAGEGRRWTVAGGIVTTDVQQTLAFSMRWISKARLYNSRSLEDAFDRYFSLFVAFNRLYSHLNRHAAHPTTGDRAQATSGFLSALGARRLLLAVEGNGGAADIELLRRLIDPTAGEFFLISDTRHDLPDSLKNQELFDNLGAQSSTTRANAVLTYLYLVRCNMFHGAKDFERRQLRIIEPATRVLQRVVGAGLAFVGEDAV